MNLLDISFSVGAFGFIYWILALQVSGGFPPFYEKDFMEAEIKLNLPFVFGIAPLLAASIIIPYLFAFIGLLSSWAGIWVRQRVQKRTDGPLPWILHPLIVSWLNRWPMFLFDAWTIGLAALGAIVIFKG